MGSPACTVPLMIWLQIFLPNSARQEVPTIQENYYEPEGIKCTLTKECVENQLFSILYILKLYHD